MPIQATQRNPDTYPSELAKAVAEAMHRLPASQANSPMAVKEAAYQAISDFMGRSARRPTISGDPSPRASLGSLRSALEAAVTAQDYEYATKLRSRIMELEGKRPNPYFAPPALNYSRNPPSPYAIPREDLLPMVPPVVGPHPYAYGTNPPMPPAPPVDLPPLGYPGQYGHGGYDYNDLY
jgi:hypothetical protein